MSAFNNAGFSPDPVGLYPYSGDLWMLAPIGLGVLIGALGFPVYLNILRQWRHPRCYNAGLHGAVDEWFKSHAWKACEG